MNNTHRNSPLDRLLIGINHALDVIAGSPQGTGRPNPGNKQPQPNLTEIDKKKVTGLLRVDHAGEVAAQGLYQGQAWVARNADVAANLQRASDEENDHLLWCRQRLTELDGQTSKLDPIWYAGSFLIGATAGLFGDKWSLGFVAETEHQVVRHLEDHLQQLPEHDLRSAAILQQMKHDEGTHATHAIHAGATPLPKPIKALMALSSKVMTKTAYWI